MNNSSALRKNKTERAFALPALALVLAVMTIMLLGAGVALAKDSQGGGFNGPGQNGGYTGPGPEFVTAEQAKALHDDAHVALKGHIVKRLGGDNYLFEDSTGTVNLEISDRRWGSQKIGPEDLVEIYGKVDKDWFEMEIEVKQLNKL